MSQNGEDAAWTVILSPVQLSALLLGKSIDEHETRSGRFWNRSFGAMDIISGALELVGAGALFIAPDPTLMTKVGAGFVGANGADDFYTGIKEFWSGKTTHSLKAHLATEAARLVGCRPDIADGAGVFADIAVPLSVARFFKAVRVVSITGETINLEEEEKLFSHAIEKHVGKSDDYLMGRISPRTVTKRSGKVVTKPGYEGAGTYSSLKEAQKFTSRVIRKNRKAIEAWASSPSTENLELHYDNEGIFSFVDYSVGRVVKRGETKILPTTKMKVVLIKRDLNGRKWFLLTSYPSFN